jgi:subtilisin family serine protease
MQCQEYRRADDRNREQLSPFGKHGEGKRANVLKGLSLCFLILSAFSAFLAVKSSLCLCDTFVGPVAQSGREEVMKRLGVPNWHGAGWKGQGLKVAVLDSGFHGFRTHLGTALPQNVETRSFRFDGNLEAKDSQHGILCAEVIHALAPEANLLLANWEPERPDRFLAAVRWARRQGARILSCSIIMPTWSDCEGHGRVHDELARLLDSGDQAGDALFFASAGNTALRHWSGPFEDGGDGFHVWRNGEGAVHRENIVQPWGSEHVSVELCCPSESDYEVTVADAVGEKIVGRSPTTEGGGARSAVVAFLPEPGHEYRVRVRRRACLEVSGQLQAQVPLMTEKLRPVTSRGAETFHLVVLGGGLLYTCPAGSIPFPGDGTEVVAVGAVDAAGRRLAYSSCGPKCGTLKPDLVATVPFPSRWRAKPFAGTSAAAPQASALAALLWSRHPHWKARQIRAALHNAACPSQESSPKWETGRGLLQLPSPG